MGRRGELPAVAGVLSTSDILLTGKSIASAQEPSGAVPWFDGGHVDPWDHVECAMALTVTGLVDEAEAAYEWLRVTQRADGSWPLQVRAGRVEDAAADTNFCAYVAAGVWHHLLVTGDESFARKMWPCVRAAVDFVLAARLPSGAIAWARDAEGGLVDEALLSGCSSIHHSLRCAVALAERLDHPRPDWAHAGQRLAHVLHAHPEAFADRARYSMDWYYPVLGGALRGEAGASRLAARWDEFVVDQLGARCVDDHPWVTGAETCELVLALDALGRPEPARRLFIAMQHLREVDGSYWTGHVYTDGKRWPEERTTWTGAAVVLAADALCRATPGNGLFRDCPAAPPAIAECCPDTVPLQGAASEAAVSAKAASTARVHDGPGSTTD